jgi:hypothetical protein
VPDDTPNAVACFASSSTLSDAIPEELWTSKSAELQEELRRVRTEMERHEVASEAYEAAGLRILELAQTVYSSYVARNPRDQAILVKTVVSNSTFDRGTLSPTYVNLGLDSNQSLRQFPGPGVARMATITTFTSNPRPIRFQTVTSRRPATPAATSQTRERDDREDQDEEGRRRSIPAAKHPEIGRYPADSHPRTSQHRHEACLKRRHACEELNSA